MTKTNPYNEFELAFPSFVRETEGVKTDVREQMVTSLLALGIENLFEMESGDIAAAFSGQIRVLNPTSTSALEGLKGGKLQTALKVGVDKKPLHSANQQISQLLNELLTTTKGRILYRDLALVLAKASQDSRFKNHLLAATTSATNPNHVEDDEKALDQGVSDDPMMDGSQDDFDHHAHPDGPPPGYPVEEI